MRRSGSFRPAVAALSVALLASGCGGSLTDDEVLAANAVEVAAGTPPPAATSTGQTPSGGAGTTTTTPVESGGSQPTASTPPPDRGAEPVDDAVGTPGEVGPIVIGSVGNYSGPAGASQAGIPRGVQTWAAGVNAAGGLFGREVQVIVVDDGGDPARYAASVQDLVENRGVVAFVGNGASLSMDGGIDYLNRVGVPVIGTDCSRFEWYEHPVFFPQCPTFTAAMRGVSHVAIDLTGARRVGAVYCSEAAACTSLRPDFRAGVPANGGELVYEADISLTQIDFTAECRNAQSAGVEIMFVAADANTTLRFARSCERQRFFPQYVGNGLTVTADVIAQRGLEDIVISNAVFPFQGATGGAFDEYRRAMDRYGDGSPGPADAFGWAAAKLFEHIATLAAAASQSITSETLLTAAHTVEGETLGGLTVPLTFTGSTPTPAPCYFQVRGEDGGWGAPGGGEPSCF